MVKPRQITIKAPILFLSIIPSFITIENKFKYYGNNFCSVRRATERENV
jgi:hypothetical protein